MKSLKALGQITSECWCGEKLLKQFFAYLAGGELTGVLELTGFARPR
jgi:hypothetical protein